MNSVGAKFYVAIKPACRCVVATILDHPDTKAETARTVAGWIRDGLIVQREDSEFVQVYLTTCPHEERQLALALE